MLRRTVRHHPLKIHSRTLSIVNANHPLIQPKTSLRRSRKAPPYPLFNIVLPYTKPHIINLHSIRHLTQMVAPQISLFLQRDHQLSRRSSSNRPLPHRRRCIHYRLVQLHTNHHYRTTHPHRQVFRQQSTVRLAQRQVTEWLALRW